MLFRDRESNDKKGPSMTPMIDVTFQLLIFFMCTMQFKTLDAKLGAYLPNDVGSGENELPKERIELKVSVVDAGKRVALDGSELPQDWSGPYTFEGRVLSYRIGPRAYPSLDAVRMRLAELHGLDPERDVTIKVQPGTVYADVVPALDACILLGFDDVAFAR